MATDRCWTITTEPDGTVRVEIVPPSQRRRAVGGFLWHGPLFLIATAFTLAAAWRIASLAFDETTRRVDLGGLLVCVAVSPLLLLLARAAALGCLTRVQCREVLEIRPGRVVAERHTAYNLGRRTRTLRHADGARVLLSDLTDGWWPPVPQLSWGLSGVPPLDRGRVEIATGTPGTDDVRILRVGFAISPAQAQALVRDLDGIHGLRAVSGDDIVPPR